MAGFFLWRWKYPASAARGCNPLLRKIIYLAGKKRAIRESPLREKHSRREGRIPYLPEEKEANKLRLYGEE
ncbi:hypothetical protein KAS50_07155 [bacterium]|nr:hypothetical protein [bacterium]